MDIASRGDSKWYQETYLQSDHWSELRTRYQRERNPNGCSVCGNYPWQLHHLSYERLWHEELDDLVPLCRGCHAEAHGKGAAPSPPRSEPKQRPPSVYVSGERVVHLTLGAGVVLRMIDPDVVELKFDGENLPRRFSVRSAPLVRTRAEEPAAVLLTTNTGRSGCAMSFAGLVVGVISLAGMTTLWTIERIHATSGH